MTVNMLRAFAALLMLVLPLALPTAAIAKDGVVEINGVVQAMPASGLVGAWTIAGRAVRTDAATVIKQQLGAIGVGALVEVKGVAEANGVTLATTIEVKQATAGPPEAARRVTSPAPSRRCPRARSSARGRSRAARCRC